MPHFHLVTEAVLCSAFTPKHTTLPPLGSSTGTTRKIYSLFTLLAGSGQLVRLATFGRFCLLRHTRYCKHCQQVLTDMNSNFQDKTWNSVVHLSQKCISQVWNQPTKQHLPALDTRVTAALEDNCNCLNKIGTSHPITRLLLQIFRDFSDWGEPTHQTCLYKRGDRLNLCERLKT